MFIIYSLMLPLRNTTGGGNHTREIEDEVIVVTFRSSGGLKGAVRHTTYMKYTNVTKVHLRIMQTNLKA